jgi:hypothetical protein
MAEQELGTSNPNTVRALGVLVDALIRHASEGGTEAAGAAWASAEESCDRLLELCTGSFGPGNADTLMAERRRLLLLGRTGRSEEALVLVEDLLDRTARIRGMDHPDTLRTRGLRLELRSQSSDGDDEPLAHEQAQLAADCRAIMGDGHPLCSALGSSA